MMSRMTNLVRPAAVATLVALGACETTRDVLGPPTPSGGDLFRTYVAMGNSITAGFQSAGINDSTQRQSYARLLATQMGTQYRYAALTSPGCPPPIANFLTQARVGGAPAATCALRVGTSVNDALNNVGVPDAQSFDPTAVSTSSSNVLTTLILGGKTQVQKALEARPTFVSVWIGGNDVLQAAYTGLLAPTPGLSIGLRSTTAQFQANYDLMLKQLTDSLPNLKGVLIGVPKVSSLPLMSTGAVIFASAAARGAINLVTGKAVTIDPNCSGSTSLISIPLLLPQIRSGTQPAYISCEAGVDPLNPLVGQLFVHDSKEAATLNAVIDADNTYLKSKADALGFAYWDPNPPLLAIRGTPQSLPFPNFTDATNPFGSYFSLDGVHPSAEGQRAVANLVIATINAKYGSTLKPVP
ncbi:MAG: SGNH/GDSL hydrolase family protein [Gemmatimonadaceae bacterium]